MAEDAACVLCNHLKRTFPLTCTAYPAGIPLPILAGEYDHILPLKGDRGIRFEPIEEESTE